MATVANAPTFDRIQCKRCQGTRQEPGAAIKCLICMGKGDLFVPLPRRPCEACHGTGRNPIGYGGPGSENDLCLICLGTSFSLTLDPRFGRRSTTPAAK